MVFISFPEGSELLPPCHIPRVGEAIPDPRDMIPSIQFPKSVASPVVHIVTNSIPASKVEPPLPPPDTPRILLPQPPLEYTAVCKSPKSFIPP